MGFFPNIRAWWALALGAVLALPVAASAVEGERAGGPVVAGYVETIHGAATVANLDLGPVTHVIDAFVLPDREGRLRPVNGLPRTELIGRCHREDRLVLVSVGGGTVPGKVFASIAANEHRLERFATEIVRFASEAQYDGLDIDWEFPESDQRALYVKLIAAVRNEMIAVRWQTHRGEPALLCCGVSTGYWLSGYDFGALAPLVDFAIYFGYDFRNPALGPWSHYEMMWPQGADAPIEASVSGVVAEIARRGFHPQKILVGLPFYTSQGRPWANARTTAGLDAAFLHPVYLEKKVGAEWITDAEAMAAKVRMALSGTVAAGRPVGGIAIWQLGHQGKNKELTDAIAREIRANSSASGGLTSFSKEVRP